MKNNIDIVMLGDSLTSRGEWDVLLYPKKIINLGHDADTTVDILARLDLAIEVHSKCIYLMIGINDMNSYKSLDKIFENYIQILNRLKIKSTSKVFVQSVLYTQMNSFNKKVKEINIKLKEYCNDNNLTFIDLNENLSRDEVLLNIYTTDGLHLNMKAYIEWANKIRSYF
ncbi:GDSL-type esterase/lipase family protein [Arcobacter sp. F2176]|uniref:GDSL-type esterase/lipase family protein n=1 Tax=Arcobacter sp. F2176 TaxID=2044511 RepID=UPI00100ACA8A|nr:GDSL-type esterase/lipase family protein [Arcobacter sp. F2176]RXJ80324.1 lipolytic protein [Arcobacter sp. F2176]